MSGYWKDTAAYSAHGNYITLGAINVDLTHARLDEIVTQCRLALGLAPTAPRELGWQTLAGPRYSIYLDRALTDRRWDAINALIRIAGVPILLVAPINFLLHPQSEAAKQPLNASIYEALVAKALRERTRAEYDRLAASHPWYAQQPAQCWSRAVATVCRPLGTLPFTASAWSTPEGKELVAFFRERNRGLVATGDAAAVIAVDDDGGDNNDDPMTVDTIVIDLAGDADGDADQEEVEPDTCLVCLIRPPNTLTLPCMHRVVCNVCSVRLGTHPVHSKTCVLCQQAITTVLQDEHDE